MSQGTSLRVCHSWWVSAEQSVIVTFSALTCSKTLLVPLSGNRKRREEAVWICRRKMTCKVPTLGRSEAWQTETRLNRICTDVPLKARQIQSGTSLSCGPTWWPVVYPQCPLATPLPFLNLVNEKHHRACEDAPVMCTAAQMGRKVGIMYLTSGKWKEDWKRIKNAEREGLEFWKQETTTHNTDQCHINYSYT